MTISECPECFWVGGSHDEACSRSTNAAKRIPVTLTSTTTYPLVPLRQCDDCGNQSYTYFHGLTSSRVLCKDCADAYVELLTEG